MIKYDRDVFILSFLTTFYISIIAASSIYFSSKNEPFLFDFAENNIDRNERSTPRSFILPATPAIAFSQEKKAEKITNNNQLKLCLEKLKLLGFHPKSKTELLQSEVKEIIIEYQGISSLDKTGYLDKETRKKLGCEHG